ncbi:MAG: 8-oxo-dGTP diphosphatase MutT [Sinobacteraceae bacterium]|nr:8-oxo-dGTP diphosphatase MutT [Nevskiaceae bacterium]
MTPTIEVVAAALFDESGRVLVTGRPPGKHMAGRQEFPGGKIAPGETQTAALQRELREELGIEIGAARLAMTLEHDYADRRVRLHFYLVESFSGVPQPLDGQTLQWVPIEDLHRQNILEADAPFVALIQQRRLPC